MADLGCPLIVGDGIYGQVVAQMNNMQGYAGTAFNVCIDALRELGDMTLDPIAFGGQFNPDNEWWHYHRPSAPDQPVIAFDLDQSLVPAPPSVDIGPDPAFVAPPTFTETAPVLPSRTGPGPLTATPPDGPPVLDEVIVPDAPNIVLPDFPVLLTIDLPPAPTITLPTFEGVSPDFDIPVPLGDFTFTPEQYVSALLDKTRNRLSDMLDGGPGLTLSVIEALRGRAHSAIDTAEQRALQTGIEEWASKGWSEPNGILVRRMDEIRADARDKRAAADRDIYINDEQIAVENLRFAVTSGISLEGTLIQAFTERQRILLDTAKTSIQVTIDVFNARINLANLQLQKFRIDAEVYRDLIQGELAKIEVYRALLEGQRLRGELNAQQVQIYSERVRALLTLVEIYKAQVAGAEAKAQVNLVRVQAFGEEVKAYGERVKAFDTEWDAFGKQLEADLTEYRRYELATNVFANRVKIWSETNTNLISQRQLKIQDKELDITGYRARLERLGTVINAEVARVESLVRVFNANIDKYRADASIEATASEANEKIFQFGLQQETTRVQTLLENARLRINQLVELDKLLVSKQEAIAQTSGTLAGAAMSAMSVSAGLKSDLSQSQSCSTEFQYKITPSS